MIDCTYPPTEVQPLQTPADDQPHVFRNVGLIKLELRAEFTGPRGGKIVNGGVPDDSFLRKAEGHKQIMDFYLVQTAAAHGVRLATRDQGTLAAWPQHAIGVN